MYVPSMSVLSFELFGPKCVLQRVKSSSLLAGCSSVLSCMLLRQVWVMIKAKKGSCDSCGERTWKLVYSLADGAIRSECDTMFFCFEKRQRKRMRVVKILMGIDPVKREEVLNVSIGMGLAYETASSIISTGGILPPPRTTLELVTGL